MNISRRFGSTSRCLAAVALLALIALNFVPTFSRSAAASGGGTVYVHMYGCPTGNGAGTTNHDILLANCTDPTVYANMILITEGQTDSGQASSNNADFTFKGVPAHIFTLQGQAVPYTSEPIVYCQNNSQNSGKYQQMVVSDTPEGAVVHPTMDAAGWVTCDWFATYFGPADNSGSVQITGFECPAGTASDADLNALTAACTQSPASADYTVESLNNPKQTMTAAGSGSAYWQFLNPDFLQISASLPAGFGAPRVFCQSSLNGVASTEFPDTGATFAYNLRANEHFSCRWFMSPLAGAVITINNHLCPGGPELEDASANDLAKTCKQKMNGVAFSLSGSGENRTGATGLESDSMILWQKVNAGQLTISEDATGGHSAPRIFCAVTPAGGGSGVSQEISSTNDAIAVNLNPGDELDCDWFNIGDSGVAQTGSMIIHTLSCPDGFDASSSDLKTTKASCTTPLDGFGYQLVGQSETFAQSSGVFAAGETFFYGVPTNEGLTLVGQPPAGLSAGAVYCGQALKDDGKPAAYDRMDLYDATTIYPSATPGAQTICLWFAQTAAQQNNVAPAATPAVENAAPAPDASGTPAAVATDVSTSDSSVDSGDAQPASGGIAIVNRVCPSGFDVSSADYSALDNNCNDNGNGYEFWLVTADGPISQNSGDVQDQAVVWTDVAPQDVAVQETISGNLSAPVVFCDGGQVDASSDGVVLATINSGATVNCVWFTTQN